MNYFELAGFSLNRGSAVGAAAKARAGGPSRTGQRSFESHLAVLNFDVHSFRRSGGHPRFGRAPRRESDHDPPTYTWRREVVLDRNIFTILVGLSHDLANQHFVREDF